MAQTLNAKGTKTPLDLTRRVYERLAAVGIELPLRLWDGTQLGPEADFRVVLNHPWSLRALLLPPTDLAAGEAYIYGDVDVEGDLVAGLNLLASASLRTSLDVRAAIGALLLQLPKPPQRARHRSVRLSGRRHSLARDRDAVQFHYDLGNDFFGLFLGKTLVYSCAYFTDHDDDLDRAQERKMDLICRKLRLEPGKRLLDIGCGWGSLALHAARFYGVRVVGVTLSTQQAELARDRVAAAGMSSVVDIRLQDYREVGEQFEAVASVGMFEHVGADKLATYFRRAHELTAPGGLFLNHGITTGRRQQARDFSTERRSFVARYVFPDGALVPAWEAVRRMEQAGFEVVDVEQMRPHYAKTLRAWVSGLERRRDEAVASTSEVDYRIWRAYMSGSVVGFEGGDLGVVQVLGSRGARIPLDRSWILGEPVAKGANR